MSELLKSLTDEQLYNTFIKGDNAALDELLVRHKEGLTFFVYGFVNSFEDAEDIMMDAFALLIAKKVKFKEKSSFKTWLYGIGRNLARAHLRKAVRMQTMPLDDSFFEDEKCPSSFAAIEGDDNKRALYKALNTLNDDYKTVIYLTYFENMDVAQIGAIMKKSSKQIYNITARAKEQLRKQLDGNISI